MNSGQPHLPHRKVWVKGLAENSHELTLPSLFTYIYVTFIFQPEGSFKVHLQFVHSSVLEYIFMYNVMSGFCGAR